MINYRVIQVTYGDGNKCFIPQREGAGGSTRWVSLTTCNYDSEKSAQAVIDSAIADRLAREVKDKTVVATTRG
jgi:hypothetical protein